MCIYRAGEGSCIICVSVPLNPNAPHVHTKGYIYRRVADGSKPKPENDRFVIDQLFQRSQELRKQHAEWHDRDPEFSENERTQPFIRLLITPGL
jgi:hypothetical protein